MKLNLFAEEEHWSLTKIVFWVFMCGVMLVAVIPAYFLTVWAWQNQMYFYIPAAIALWLVIKHQD